MGGDSGYPRGAMLLASSLGLGFLPLVPGTWGSLGGVALYIILVKAAPVLARASAVAAIPVWVACLAATIVVSLPGVWAAGVVSRHLKKSDPGVVVIDEVAGQLIAYLPLATLDWRWLLAGFLLFRAFDIWKPSPAREAEKLPGGLGIMADDWIAGAYAALVLGVARWAL
jgi:phosphatidylglycerophosphatase A